MEVALLTGGADRPYAFGIATALMARGVHLDVIAGDELRGPEFLNRTGVNFLNLRGDQGTQAGLVAKMTRVLVYYARLIRYALTARPRVFHILWNNKFEWFDRTILLLYYKLLGKKLVLTVHNVNAGWRDGTDSFLNHATLKAQYRLVDHIFVHTQKMKSELRTVYGVRESAVTVIPFGINNAVPNTDLTPAEARRQLEISPEDKVILFFGSIAPYKGLEYLVTAFQHLAAAHSDYRLIVAGSPKKGFEAYWKAIKDDISALAVKERIVQRIEFIPDAQTEVYFKAADVLVLPYTEIFQSGVLFLGYSFGLPVIAADVGSLRDDIVDGRTGSIFTPRDPVDLARSIESYFASDLFRNLATRRLDIMEYAQERYSWETVGRTTQHLYAELLGHQPPEQMQVPT